MLITDEPVFTRPLAGGLTLRTVSTQAELDQVAALSAVIHEPAVMEMTRKIFNTHPAVTGRDLVYIADADGAVIATLCLIPWTLRLGPVELPAAELGIVGTLERYRGQGLNRALMDYFWQRFKERGALLSIIQGIPYFYRQYGYEYSLLPLEGGWRIQPDQIPLPLEPGYQVRPAAAADIPHLTRLYDAQMAQLDLSAVRNPATWAFLLDRTPVPEAMQHDTLILEDPGGAVVGYFRVPDFHFNQNLLTIDEVSAVDFNAGLAILNHLKGLAGERNKDGIRLHLPASSGLVRMACAFGALDMGRYSWQVSIPDRAAFLRRLGPVLEQRLSGSLFAGLTGSYSLNLYREILRLTFTSGRLQSVDKVQAEQHTLLNLPPNQFVPLALGGCSLTEIHAAFPDAFAHSPWQLLVETLFPKTQGFLATQY